MDVELIRRIEREAGMSGLVEALTTLPPTDLQSLLLAVYESRASKLTPADILKQYADNRFLPPSPTGLRRFHELDAIAMSLLDSHEWLDLSPVGPLGASAGLGDLDQKRMVTTIRNSEVVSDPTNVMALEAALRRRADRGTAVRLATSHRVLRGQAFDHPLARQHFRLIALCTAGRDRGNHEFEFGSLLEHLRFYLRFLAAAVPSFTQRVLLTSLSGDALMPILDREVAGPLRDEFDLEVGFDQEREAARNYYDDIAFSIEVRSPAQEIAIVDGGFTTWTQTLLGDNKERLLISAVGTELVASL